MKRIILAAILCLCAAIPAYAEDEYRWFMDGVYGMQMSDAWEGRDRGLGQQFFYNEAYPKGCLIAVTQPIPIPEDGPELALYTGVRMAILHAGLKEYGTGRVTEEDSTEFNGIPAVMARFVMEKDGEPTYEGALIGMDFDGYYATFGGGAPIEHSKEFIPDIGPIMTSFVFDRNAAGKVADKLDALSEEFFETFAEVFTNAE